MERINFKKDIKKIYYILLSIISIISIFIVFSIIVLFLIYYPSKYYPRIYSLIASLIILAIVIFLIIKKIKIIKNTYKKFSNIFIYLLFSPYTLIISIILIGLEFIFFRFIELVSMSNINFLQNIAIIINLDKLFEYEKIIYTVTFFLNIINPFFALFSLIIVTETLLFRILFEIIYIIPAVLIIFIVSIIFIVAIFMLYKLKKHIMESIKNKII